jgi:hypothetical protein
VVEQVVNDAVHTRANSKLMRVGSSHRLELMALSSRTVSVAGGLFSIVDAGGG